MGEEKSTQKEVRKIVCRSVVHTAYSRRKIQHQTYALIVAEDVHINAALAKQCHQQCRPCKHLGSNYYHLSIILVISFLYFFCNIIAECT